MAPPPSLNWQQRHDNWVTRRMGIAIRWADRHTRPTAVHGAVKPATTAHGTNEDDDSATQEYRAVAPDSQTGGSAAARRATDPVRSMRAQLHSEYVDQLKRARADQDERRTHRRVNINSAITFTSDSNFFTGLTRDISQGGLFIATHCPLAVGSRVDLRFSLPDGGPTISVQCQVRWTADFNADSDGHPGYGVEFLDLTEADQTRIERFVELRESLYYDV